MAKKRMNAIKHRINWDYRLMHYLFFFNLLVFVISTSSHSLKLLYELLLK
jgi:hypothetical protein